MSDESGLIIRRATTSSLTLAAALFTVTLWASAFVGIRSAGRALSPGALSLGRLLVGGLVLVAILVAKRERLPTWRELRPVAAPLVACGVLWFAGYSVALNAAEQRVDAGTAAMLVNVGPILIAILAGVILREGFPRALLLGCSRVQRRHRDRSRVLGARGLEHGRLAAMTYLVPPISILLGWLLLGEAPPALAFAGGALCLLGVAITRRSPPAPKRP